MRMNYIAPKMCLRLLYSFDGMAYHMKFLVDSAIKSVNYTYSTMPKAKPRESLMRKRERERE